MDSVNNKTNDESVKENIEKCYELHRIIRMKMSEFNKNVSSCPKLENREQFEPELSNYAKYLMKYQKIMSGGM